MTTGKTIALTRWTFVGQVMSLLFNMLSRVVITFLPRSKRLKLWKILKEMGIPDHLTCLLRNLSAGQEATVRTGHGTDWFQIGKGVRKTLDWKKHKLESRLPGEISITSDMPMTPPL